MSSDIFQLDAFNHETGAYDVVMTSDDRVDLDEEVELLGLKAWRIWNRTTRAERDRMLPPVSQFGKTATHRFSRVHLSPKKRSKIYATY